MVYEVLKSDNELNGERRRAMYNYRCDVCGETIKKGEIYDSARGMAPVGTSWEDGYRVPPRYWTFRTHLYHCGVPLQCQMGLHEFKYQAQIGDSEDFWDFNYQREGTFCINCYEELKEQTTSHEQ